MRPAMLIMTLSAISLAACNDNHPPPSIRYDSADFKPAAIEPEPQAPAAIEPKLEEFRMPDLPVPEIIIDDTPPPKRVDAANKAAIAEPTTHGYLNGVQVYPFAEGAIYRLYAAPEQVTDIVLQVGEVLNAISAGDTVRWVVGDTVSGTGAARQAHVLVKPTAPGLRTNLVIMTDRRSYHLSLESTERTAMSAISWAYPDSMLVTKHEPPQVEPAAPAVDSVPLGDLHFRYVISGDNPPWRPVRAFDDGHKVYIEFPARLDQGEAPPLFVIGPDGDGQLVNYRVRGNHYIVDRLFAAAELRLGGQKAQQVVRISRTDAR
jgi:type IV secretion system protein TrbG